MVAKIAHWDMRDHTAAQQAYRQALTQIPATGIALFVAQASRL